MVKKISIISLITLIMFITGCGSPTRSNDLINLDQIGNDDTSSQDKDNTNQTPSQPNIPSTSNNPQKPKLTQPFVKVLKTGQTDIYSNYDDGYYQLGVDRNYTRDDVNEIVIDHVTKLMWQDDINMSDRSLKKDYLSAVKYCKDLTLGNYSNWRVPHIKELQTIVDDGRYEPALNPVFENYIQSYYYSSTKFVNDEDLIWVLFMIHGNSSIGDSNSQFYVRCVRNVDKESDK